MASTSTQTRHTVDTPLSKDDYLDAVSKARPGYQATQDATDRNIGATVQGVTRKSSDADPFAGRSVDNPLNDLPGQVYETWQLPDPQAAVDAELPPVVVPEHLIVESSHAQGPDVLDVANRELRRDLGNPRLDETGHTVSDEKVDDLPDVDDLLDDDKDEAKESPDTGAGSATPSPAKTTTASKTHKASASADTTGAPLT